MQFSVKGPVHANPVSQWMIQSLQRFEWILKLWKSSPETTNLLEYLGLILDMVLSRIFLHQDNLLSVHSCVHTLQSQNQFNLYLHEVLGPDGFLFESSTIRQVLSQTIAAQHSSCLGQTQSLDPLPRVIDFQFST